MIRYFSILLFFLIISCNQSSSQTDKNYIKNLEEKNRALEKELIELKSSSEQSGNTQALNQKRKGSTDYFTIGSTIEEVIEVMGEPTSYMSFAPEAKKFHYGISTIYFYHGEVISYDNLDKNLKVRVKK